MLNRQRTLVLIWKAGRASFSRGLHDAVPDRNVDYPGRAPRRREWQPFVSGDDLQIYLS
jgi:hypothetical protein